MVLDFAALSSSLGTFGSALTGYRLSEPEALQGSGWSGKRGRYRADRVTQQLGFHGMDKFCSNMRLAPASNKL